MQAFRYWHADFVEKLKDLASVASLPLIREKLKSLLGEKTSISAVDRHFEVLNKKREKSKLFIMKSGAITTAVTAIPVKANTFFGKHG
jgi:hypothetical protein